ncbi:hypothetical protein GOQ27_03360 [Clostridium sp. D2Q-11]|uniref:Spo0E like sporulation regulatory protein n=1 Tax=Anaeromonas frigoriresistens TaxID=2683708 RepID=A0A942UQS4_9FIRM|nr:hypothetical protein [Anaeromonas frigoriresistens]MBS4537483.1 hypothetical protein [Anaeromonas frigoriresistens]
MRIEDQILIGRNILSNAIDMNMSKEIILKISEKVDNYIIRYYINDKIERDIKKENVYVEDWICFEPYE